MKSHPQQSKKYLAPDREGTLKGPKISQCINSKGLTEEMELMGKGSLVYLARAQTLQLLFGSKGKCSKDLAIKSNLEEDKCPRRRCHKIVEVF